MTSSNNSTTTPVPAAAGVERSVRPAVPRLQKKERRVPPPMKDDSAAVVTAWCDDTDDSLPDVEAAFAEPLKLTPVAPPRRKKPSTPEPTPIPNATVDVDDTLITTATIADVPITSPPPEPVVKQVSKLSVTSITVKTDDEVPPPKPVRTKKQKRPSANKRDVDLTDPFPKAKDQQNTIPHDAKSPDVVKRTPIGSNPFAIDTPTTYDPVPVVKKAPAGVYTVGMIRLFKLIGKKLVQAGIAHMIQTPLLAPQYMLHVDTVCGADVTHYTFNNGHAYSVDVRQGPKNELVHCKNVSFRATNVTVQRGKGYLKMFMGIESAESRNEN